MPRVAGESIPSYRLHKQSGQAIVTISGRDKTLGKHGTRASRDRYNQLVAEWLSAGRRLPDELEPLTVSELVNAYRKHAATYYRRADGTPTDEAARLVRELSPLLQLYRRLPAAEFSPLKLKAVRQKMVAAGWVRTSINHAVGTVRRMFKWGTENELIPAHVLHALQAVIGLKLGRSEAKESIPTRPVPVAHVNATLTHVSAQVRAMIELQLLTGMRSGEVCIMRTGDVDRTGKLWVYRPTAHKTQHHGHAREVYLGPRAQQVLTPFLKLDPEAHIFSPAEAEQHRREQRHAQRKTPLSCGNVPGTSRKRQRRRPPGERYEVESYRRAIARACDEAFPPPTPLAPATIEGKTRKRPESRRQWLARLTEEQRNELAAWQREHRWHPHQLRHRAATELRKTHGIEAAQVILGHKTLSVTQLYAEQNVEAAQRIMAAVG